MRLKRIELVRLIAIFLIVWAHCQFFDGIQPTTTFSKASEIGIIVLMRFTIQFFFLVSGYFVGNKIAEDPANAYAIAWKYSRKIMIIFFFWSIIYALENPQYFMRLLTRDPLTLVFEGTRIHLWFLVSLGLTIWLFALWPFNKKGNSFLVFAAAIYVLGLLGGSYLPTPIGVNLDFNTRNGVFFGALFFAMGAIIRVHKLKVSPAAAWTMFLSGLAWFAAETYFLWANWSSLPIRHDYLFGSIPYGLGAFFVALSARRETKLDIALEPYSKYVLGIYVSHLLFLDLWKPLGTTVNPIVWIFLMPALVFGSSLLAVILLSKTPLRRLVM